MRTRILLISVILTLGLVLTAMGQSALTNYNFSGDGARARGMGGAFISIANDASAISWNPAGLINVVDPQISIQFDFYMPKSNFMLDYTNSAANNIDMEFDDNKFPLQFASFTAPVRIKGHPFVGSASFSSISTAFNYFEANPDSGTVDTTAVNLSVENESRLNQLRLGFGTNVYKKLNFGAAINVFFGNGYVDSALVWESSFIHPTQGTLVNVLAKGFVWDTISFSGVNFMGGLQWKTDKYSIGAVAKLPFWLNQEHVKHIHDSIYENGLLQSDLLRGDIDEQDKEKFQVPWMLGLGASVNVTPEFLISSDFEWRRYGASMYRIHYDTILSSGDVEENFIEFSAGLENGYQVRFGGEYILDAGFTRMPLRGGFSYQTFGFRHIEDLEFNFKRSEDVTIDSLQQSFTLGDQITGYTIAAGFGMHWELIKLDFAFEYEARDKDISGSDHYGPFEAVQENRSTRISMNFTGLFK